MVNASPSDLGLDLPSFTCPLPQGNLRDLSHTIIWIVFHFPRILHTGYDCLLLSVSSRVESRGTDLPTSLTPGTSVSSQTVCLSVQVRTYYSLDPSGGEDRVFDLSGCLAISTPPMEEDMKPRPSWPRSSILSGQWGTFTKQQHKSV